MSGRSHALKTLLALATVDTTPLRRHRDFRLLFTGQLVSFFGTMMTSVAIPYQVYTLTHSTLAVGLLGLAQLVPLLIFAFLGGALADAVDRRRLVQITECGLALLSGVLFLNALLPHPQIWLLYVVAATSTAVDALQRPALGALLPRLVEVDELAAAGALSSIRTTFGMIVGPAVAGVLIATVGLQATYGVDTLTFMVSLVALYYMRAVPPAPDAERPSLRSIAQGLRYARSRPELLGTYIVDFIAMFFGMPIALFPVLAEQFAHADRSLRAATILGFLYVAPSVGAFLATATSGWTSRVHRHGLAVIIAAAAWGLAITCMGLAPSLAVALVCLGLAGGADSISGIFRSVIWNKTIPDSLRGRLAGIELISYSSGPLLGEVESGAVASAFTPRISVLSGGIICVIGVVLLGFALPDFRRYTDRASAGRDDPPGLHGEDIAAPLPTDHTGATRESTTSNV